MAMAFTARIVRAGVFLAVRASVPGSGPAATDAQRAGGRRGCRPPFDAAQPPSTRRVDLADKQPVYAREGAGYLWLVDPLIRKLEAFELREGQWVPVAAVRDDDRVSVRPFDVISFGLATLWP